jgi:hypothetical protein
VDVRSLPPAPCGTLHYVELPAGTSLWRVHWRRHPADTFCPIPSDTLFGGGRFDSTLADSYPFLYAGLNPETALCETLLRALKFHGASRQLLRAEIKNRVLSRLTTTIPLVMLSLASAVDLASICQPDDWLLRADGHEYAQTRAWAHWLRKQVGSATGLLWLSRYNSPEKAIILFGDRCPASTLPAILDESIILDDDGGAAYLNTHLAPYGVSVARPRPVAVTSSPRS